MATYLYLVALVACVAMVTAMPAVDGDASASGSDSGAVQSVIDARTAEVTARVQNIIDRAALVKPECAEGKTEELAATKGYLALSGLGVRVSKCAAGVNWLLFSVSQ